MRFEIATSAKIPIENFLHNGGLLADPLTVYTRDDCVSPSVSLCQLALKTTNGARSAYACFLFQRSFFHSYSDRRGGARGRGDEDEDEEEEQEALKCKITIKVWIILVPRPLQCVWE